MVRCITPDAVRGFIIGAAVIAVAVFGGQAVTRPSIPSDPLTDPASIAAALNVQIVFDTTACGDYLASYMRFNGCATASTIYLADDLDAETQHRVVLHELGHVIQYRLGVDRDECAADIFADLYGGPGNGTGCKP